MELSASAINGHDNEVRTHVYLVNNDIIVIPRNLPCARYAIIRAARNVRVSQRPSTRMIINKV